MIEVYYLTLFHVDALLYVKDDKFLWSDKLPSIHWQNFSDKQKFNLEYIKLFEMEE